MGSRRRALGVGLVGWLATAIASTVARGSDMGTAQAGRRRVEVEPQTVGEAQTTIFHGSVPESISARDFGAIGDGNSHPAYTRFRTIEACRSVYPHAMSLNDEIDWLAIQAAIDQAIYFLKIPHVRIPTGIYRLSAPLQLGYGVPFRGTPYTTVFLRGDGYDYSTSGCGTTLVTDYSNAPALCIQGGRGTRWSGIALRGKNSQWIRSHAFWTGQSNLDATDAVSWLDPGLATTASSDTAPYAGVAIDPYSGVRPRISYPPVPYPAWLGNVNQYQKAPSSMVSGEHFLIDGFAVGLVIQPSGSNEQGDFIEIGRYWITNCAFGMSIGQSDARLSNPSGGYINQCHTALTNNHHGRRQGKFGSVIHNLAMDRCIQWFDIGDSAYPYAGPLTFQNCYGENIWRIGNFGKGSIRDQMLQLNQCEASFAFQNDKVGYPATIVKLGGASSQLRISGGTYRGYHGIFQIYAAGKYVGVDGAYFSPLNQPATLAEKTLHSATAGGVFIFDQSRPVRPELFCAKFDASYGRDGILVRAQAVVGRICESARDIPICIHSEVFRGVGHAAVSYQKMPVGVVRKEQLEGISLSSGVLRFSWPNRSPAEFAMFGPSVGDALMDLKSGTVFYVKSTSGRSVRAVQQNNYRVRSDFQKQNLTPIDLVHGEFGYITGRGFSPADYVYADMSDTSNVLKSVSAADGRAVALGHEIRVGDLLYCDPVTEGYVTFDGQANRVMAIDVNAKTIMMHGNLCRTANGASLPLWIVPPLDNEPN